MKKVKSSGGGGVKQTVKKDTGGSRPTSKNSVQSDTKFNVTTRTPDPVVRKSSVQGKEVPTSRIDSARKANPAFNRALGPATKGSGGMDTYRDAKADLINSALKGKKK